MDSETNSAETLNINSVEFLASIGICARAMAELDNMELSEFLTQKGELIKRAKLRTDAQVLNVFREMATSKKNWPATAMWIKMQCMHLFDAPPESKSQSTTGKAASEFKTRPIEFDVYCNDGEPNFDY